LNFAAETGCLLEDIHLFYLIFCLYIIFLLAVLN